MAVIGMMAASDPPRTPPQGGNGQFGKRGPLAEGDELPHGASEPTYA